MAKTKKATKTKRSRSRAVVKPKLLFRYTRFHTYLLLLAVLVVGSIFAYNSLTAHADSGPFVYSGTLGYGATGGFTTVVPLTNESSATVTATLSYTGLTPGSVSLSGQSADSNNQIVTESSYGNPITIQFNVSAWAIPGFQVYESYLLNDQEHKQGSFTLSISYAPTSLPPTTVPFRSMPCDYTPITSAFYLPVEPCSSSPSPGPTPTPTPTPIPTPPPVTSPVKDTTPPIVPTGLLAKAVGPNNIALTWNASTDPDSSVAGYHIYRGSSKSTLSLLTSVATTSYSDVSLSPATTYYYYIDAYDSSGNVSGLSDTVGATTLTPNPPILPSILIASPKNGDTVSGMVDLLGTSGNTPVKTVQVEIDNNGFVSASGTATWDYKLNTRLYADTVHTITAKAIDSAGNSNTASITVTFKNGSYPAAPPLVQGEWVSPEGMTVNVDSKGKNPHTGQPWTIADVYYMVKACAVGTGDFGKIAPYYTVDLNDQVGTWADDYTVVGIGTGWDGNWSNYTAASYLNGATGPMLTQPYDVSCYEYGHAWTEYYNYIVNYPTTANGLHGSGQTAPPNYLNERWVNQSGSITLAQNNYCQYSTDGWDGCITDDRRILFGGSGTNGGNDAADLVPGESNSGYQEPDIRYINSNIVLPQSQPGLADWYINHWITGK